MEAWEAVAQAVAGQLHAVLGLDVEASVLRGEQQREARRRLAAKEPRDWDVLLLEQDAQSIDTPPLKLHRAFVGRSGEFRAGRVDARFEQLLDDLRGQRSQIKQLLGSNRIDRYVTEQSLALFLVAPKVLYAVNRDVSVRPVRHHSVGSALVAALTGAPGNMWSPLPSPHAVLAAGAGIRGASARAPVGVTGSRTPPAEPTPRPAAT
jgi:hypothetical protein